MSKKDDTNFQIISHMINVLHSLNSIDIKTEELKRSKQHLEQQLAKALSAFSIETE